MAESLFIGIEVGVEGFQSLNIIGIAPLTGFVSAYGNTREIAPLIAAIAVASQIGCKFTSQLGAQRISEEIDALEVMAIPSIPYLVTTRIIGAFTVIVPLYLVGLFGSYIATKYTVVVFFGQSVGHLRALLQSVPAQHRRLLLGAEGDGLHRLHHDHPHVLRLQRGRRPGRGRPGDRARDPRHDRASSPRATC